jgi:hypothetical protein
LTYSAVPPGSGPRIGVDRDADGWYDADEIDAGTDPADPLSPLPPTATPVDTASPTATPSPSATDTATAVATATETQTATPTTSATLPPTPTPSATATAADTPTATFTPTATPVCGSGAVLIKPRLVVRRNGDPAGDETLTLSGRLQLSALLPVIDPLSTGFVFTVRDPQGGVLFSRTVPPGALGAGENGWHRNALATKWAFKDKLGTAAGGVTTVVVAHLTKVAPGYFKFRVKGRANDFQVPPGGAPVQVEVILSGIREGSNLQCGSVAFQAAGGTRPSCALTGGGKLQCR